MKIQANSSGTRSIEIAEDHLQTIEKYQLFRDLIDSNGYVDEQVLDKLKLNIRSLLAGDAGKDKALLAARSLYKAIPIDDDTLTELLSTAATVITAVVAWWKNNS